MVAAARAAESGRRSLSANQAGGRAEGEGGRREAIAELKNAPVPPTLASARAEARERRLSKARTRNASSKSLHYLFSSDSSDPQQSRSSVSARLAARRWWVVERPWRPWEVSRGLTRDLRDRHTDVLLRIGPGGPAWGECWGWSRFGRQGRYG